MHCKIVIAPIIFKKIETTHLHTSLIHCILVVFACKTQSITRSNLKRHLPNYLKHELLLAKILALANFSDLLEANSTPPTFH